MMLQLLIISLILSGIGGATLIRKIWQSKDSESTPEQIISNIRESIHKLETHKKLNRAQQQKLQELNSQLEEQENILADKMRRNPFKRS
jgi:hypothetical protein